MAAKQGNSTMHFGHDDVTKSHGEVTPPAWSEYSGSGGLAPREVVCGGPLARIGRSCSGVRSCGEGSSPFVILEADVFRFVLLQGVF